MARAAQLLGLIYLAAALFGLVRGGPSGIIWHSFLVVAGSVGVGLLLQKRWALWAALPIQALQVPAIVTSALSWRLVLGAGLYVQFMDRPDALLVDKIGFSLSHGAGLILGLSSASEALRQNQFFGAVNGAGLNIIAIGFAVVLIKVLRRGDDEVVPQPLSGPGRQE